MRLRTSYVVAAIAIVGTILLATYAAAATDAIQAGYYNNCSGGIVYCWAQGPGNSPTPITLKSPGSAALGDTWSVTLGPEHNFVLASGPGVKNGTVQCGFGVTCTFTPSTAGTYNFFCSQHNFYASIVVADAASQVAAQGGTSFTVNAGQTQTLQAKVEDGSGNPVSGVSVTWAVTAGGGSVTPTSSTSDSNGLVSTTLTTGTTAGTNTATATSSGLSGSPITYTVTGVAGSASAIASSGGSSFSGVTAGGTQVLKVLVTDANGNPVTGTTVNWAVTEGSGSVSPLSSTTASNGIASTTLNTAATAGTNKATASSGALSGSPVTFTVSTVAGAASTLAASGGTSFSGITAGGTQALQALVTDSNGNPVNGATVNWAVTQGGGSIAPASSTTGSNGIASSTLTTGTTAGANQATASSSGLSGSPVTYSVSTVSGSASRVAASGGSSFSGVTAGGTQVLQALVTDSNGNPVSGATVNWAVTQGGGSVAPASSTTGSDGMATSTLTTGTSVGPNQATASSSGLSGSPVTYSVATVAGSASNLAASGGASFTGVTAGAPQVLTAAVRDANGNAVSGATVSWTITGGSGSLSQASTSTGSDGMASSTLTTGTAAGTNTVQAAAAGLSGSPLSFTVSTVAGAASSLVAHGGGSFPAVTAGDVQELQALVTDGHGNPIGGFTVDWAVVGGSGFLDHASSATSSSGIATANLTTGTRAGSNSVTASGHGIGQIAFSVSTIAGPASRISDANGASFTGVRAGAAEEIAALVTDANGNVVSGTSLSWAVASGGGALDHATSVTNATGIATANLTTGTTVGTNHVTVSGVGLNGPVTYMVTTQAGPAARIAVGNGPVFDGVTAGGQEVLKATVFDVNGNPVANEVVNWLVTSGAGSLNAPSTTSDATGVASAILTTGKTAGWNNASASVTGLSGSPLAFTVTTIAGSSTTIAAENGPAFPSIAAGNLQTLSVRVVDAGGNPAAGILVQWAVTSGQGSLNASSSTTGTDGIASIILTTAPHVGSATVTAASGTLTGSPVAFTIDTVAGPALTLVAHGASAYANATPGGTQNVSILVTDANGNPVSGATITWAVVQGGGTVSPTPSATDTNGVANATITTGAQAGENEISATTEAIPNASVLFFVNTTAPRSTTAASAGTSTALSLGAVTNGTVDDVAAAARTLMVRVADATGAPVAGVVVDWTVENGPGTLNTTTTSTNATGVASVSFIGISAGESNITASGPAFGNATETFHVFTVAAEPVHAGPHLTLVPGSLPTRIVAGEPLNISLKIDDNRSRIASATVNLTWANKTFSVVPLMQSGDAFTAHVPTSAAGIVSARLRVIDQAGSVLDIELGMVQIIARAPAVPLPVPVLGTLVVLGVVAFAWRRRLA
ncbi:MAG: beta strand repeat-containing protein [Thermoplasmatota archaeon]